MKCTAEYASDETPFSGLVLSSLQKGQLLEDVECRINDSDVIDFCGDEIL